MAIAKQQNLDIMKSYLHRPIALILASILGILTGYSQEASRDSFNIKKAEINIAVSDIFAKTRPYDYYFVNSSYITIPYRINSFEYIPNTNLQLGAKFHTLKGAIRLTCGYSYSNYSSEDKTINNVEITYTGSNARFATGYEWQYTFTRVNIFFGADFSWAISNYNYKLVDGSDEIINKANIAYLGVNPLVGVNYFITPSLSIGTELRFTVEMYTGSEEVDNILSNTSYEYDISGLRTYFGPLGFISVNIHF